ncbi:hypothetical protein EQZ09_09305 [Clostridium perfringens]|nr:hypothetical protein [Clostridium perfringens]
MEEKINKNDLGAEDLLDVLYKLDVEIVCGDKDEKGFFNITFKANGKEITKRAKRNNLLDYCFFV